MTIGAYIQSKLKRFNFTMSEEELEANLAEQDLTPETEYSSVLSDKTKKVLISIIPELLLAPEIRQGDFGIKYNVDGIKAYYSMLCNELGLPDIYNPIQARIIDRSDIW